MKSAGRVGRRSLIALLTVVALSASAIPSSHADFEASAGAIRGSFVCGIWGDLSQGDFFALCYAIATIASSSTLVDERIGLIVEDKQIVSRDDLAPDEAITGPMGETARLDGDIEGCSASFDLGPSLDAEREVNPLPPSVDPDRPHANGVVGIHKVTYTDGEGEVCEAYGHSGPFDLGLIILVDAAGASGGFDEGDVDVGALLEDAAAAR